MTPARLLPCLLAAIAFSASPAFAQTTAPAPGPAWGNTKSLTIPDDSGFTINVRNHQDLIVMGRTGCPIAVVGQEVWDLQKQQKTGVKIPLHANRDSLAALTDDGSLLAVGKSRRSSSDDDSSADATVWNTKTGQKVCEIPSIDRDQDLDYLGLAGDNQLLISARPNSSRKPVMEVWDPHTGKLIRRFACNFGSAATTSISPDGRYVACADDSHVLVFDIATGQQAASMAAPDAAPSGVSVHIDRSTIHVGPANIPFLNVSSLAFSPDGAHLVAATSFGAANFFCWNNQAALTDAFSIAMNEFEIRTRPFVQWSPDNANLLVNQHWLVDLKSHRPLWSFPVPFADNPQSLFLDANRLFVIHSHPTSRVEIVTIPSDGIHHALALMNDPKTPALLQPGKSISLDIQVTSSDPNVNQTSTHLAELVKNRLAPLGITVADNQPSVLTVHFDETRDPPRKIVSRPSPFDSATQDTGRSASPCHGTLTLSVHARGSDKIRWSTELSSDSPAFSNDTITDASLEQAMLQFLDSRLEQQPLPYFLANDDAATTLPLGLTPSPAAQHHRTPRPTRTAEPLVEMHPYDPFHRNAPSKPAPAPDPALNPRQRT